MIEEKDVRVVMPDGVMIALLVDRAAVSGSRYRRAPCRGTPNTTSLCT